MLNPEATLEASVLGSWRGGMYSDSTPADRPIYDPVTRRVFNGSGDRHAIDIIDISDPTHPATVGAIDVSAYGDEPQAVAIHEGILAVTVVTHDRPEIPGAILLFNVDGIPVADPIALTDPNKAEFSHDGRTLVVTQSGFAGDDLDPESGVAVVAMGSVPWDACRFDVGRCRLEPTVAFIDFRGLDDDAAALTGEGRSPLRARGQRGRGAGDRRTGFVPGLPPRVRHVRARQRHRQDRSPDPRAGRYRRGRHPEITASPATVATAATATAPGSRSGRSGRSASRTASPCTNIAGRNTW